ncbi:SAM-dependent methyltransferase [Sphaerisporangium sp. NPDC051017]|uniref:SAM-dependent methyltransferase n=1 Tax=Sphaerisporangium sp. NPDC051017 TaxID=3154636 RepID=UPI003416F107
MTEGEKTLPGIDPRTPSVARMYDYYLGGKDNFASDREAAEKIIKLFPNARDFARDNRGFLKKAVRLLAESGITQFIDIGTGLPTQENVHEVAIAAAPDARVVYVDNDPIVLVHARALLADSSRTIVVEGDLRDPKAILEHPRVRGHLDLDKPFAVILCAIVHFVDDDDEAASIVSYLRGAMAPGGALVLSHGYKGRVAADAVAQAEEIYTRTRGTLKLRDHDTIAEYFTGLDMVEPGLTYVQAWRPDFEVSVDPSRPGALVGVGLVPRT